MEKNDLLYNRTNSLAQICKVGIFRGTKDDSVTFASYLVRLRTNESINPEYLNFLLNSNFVLSLARSMAIPSIGQANLSSTNYIQIKISVPPLPEQNDILSYIQSVNARIDALITEAESVIELLKERRSALISAAVMGKIDVRSTVMKKVPV